MTLKVGLGDIFSNVINKTHISSVRMQLVDDSVCLFVRASVSCYLTSEQCVCRSSVRLHVDCRVVCLASGQV